MYACDSVAELEKTNSCCVAIVTNCVLSCCKIFNRLWAELKTLQLTPCTPRQIGKTFPYICTKCFGYVHCIEREEINTPHQPVRASPSFSCLALDALSGWKFSNPSNGKMKQPRLSSKSAHSDTRILCTARTLALTFARFVGVVPTAVPDGAKVPAYCPTATGRARQLAPPQ